MVDLIPVLGPVKELGGYIREQRMNARISLRALADRAGVSNPYLSQVERGLRRPSADVLAQIARGLSISVEGVLARAGVLDAPEATAVATAIRADDQLSERHKVTLLEVYAALRQQGQQDTSAAAGPTHPSADPAAARGRKE